MTLWVSASRAFLRQLFPFFVPTIYHYGYLIPFVDLKTTELLYRPRALAWGVGGVLVLGLVLLQEMLAALVLMRLGWAELCLSIISGCCYLCTSILCLIV